MIEMKRIILFFVLSFLSVNLYAGLPAAAAETEEAQYYIEFLNVLGILDMNSYTEKELAAQVTRGEFAAMLADTLLVNCNVYKQQYWDVGEEYQYAKAITALTALGYVNGYGDGAFGPNDALEQKEAFTMAVCALGYKTNFSDTAILQQVYTSKAAELGLDKNIKGVMTLKNTYCLLYNMLNANTAAVDMQAGAVSAKTGEYTLLYKLYGIERGEGVMQSAGLLGITKQVSCTKGTVVIAGEKFNIHDDSVRDRLGYFVTYFYDEDENLIYCFPKKKQENLRIEAENIEDFSNMTLTYYHADSTTRKRIKIPSDADIVHNGEAIDFDADFDDALLRIDSGYIDLIDNDRDGEYEVILIWESYTLVVQSAYEKDDAVFCIIDKNNAANNLTIDQSENIELECVDKNGIERDIKTLYQNDIITVYQSKNGEILRLFVSENKMEAVISATSTDDADGSIQVMIDGTTYDTVKNFNDSIKIGQTAIIYFDIFGEIASIEYIDAGDYRIGLMLYARYTESEDGVYVRVLNANGEDIRYTCAEKVKIDGIKYKDADDIYRAITGAVPVSPPVIRIKLNSDQLVTDIDPPAAGAESNKDTLVYRNPGCRSLWYKTTKTLSGHYVLTDSTIVFSVPENQENYDEYKVISPSKMGNDKTVNADVYTIGNNGFAASAVVLDSIALAADYGDIAIVCGKEKVLNAEDEAVWNIQLSQKGKIIDRFVYEEDEALIEELAAGDIIRFSQTPNDELDGVIRVYDYIGDAWCYDEGKGLSPNPMSEYTQNANYRLFLGKVYEVSSNYVGLCGLDLKSVTDFDIEAYRFSDQWYVYEAGKKVENVRKATLEDIVEFKYSPNDASKVIIQTQWAQPQVAYIIKR